MDMTELRSLWRMVKGMPAGATYVGAKPARARPELVTQLWKQSAVQP